MVIQPRHIKKPQIENSNWSGLNDPAMAMDLFLQNGKGFDNGWVDFPGMKSLYLRKLERMEVDGKPIQNVIVISSVESEGKNKGHFSNLVMYLRNYYSQCSIYVENAHGPGFDKKLEHLGFKQCNEHLGALNYIWVSDRKEAQ